MDLTSFSRVRSSVTCLTSLFLSVLPLGESVDIVMCRTSTFLNDGRYLLSLTDSCVSRSPIMAFPERYIYSSVRTAQRRGKIPCSRNGSEGGVVCMDRGLTQSSFAGYPKPNGTTHTSLCVATVSSCGGRSQSKGSVGWHQVDVRQR